MTGSTQTYDPIRERFSADGTVGADGSFEIIAITAGEGNGWHFSESTLRESVGLWEGAEVFIDHAAWAKSVRNLGGVLHSARWDAGCKGIKCKLKAIGPSGPLLTELGRQMLAEAPGEPAVAKPRVGFSADVLFTAQGQKVQKVLRVNSVDLVFNPARGGAFVRALNSMGGFATMDPEEVGTTGTTPAAGSPAGQVGQGLNGGQVHGVQEHGIQAQMAHDTGQAQAVRAALCGHLLESGLAASRLPGVVQERIRKQFAGQVFEPAALTAAIDDARAMVSELTGAGVVQGVGGAGRISGMFSSEDQITAAMFDLCGVARPDELRGLRTARLGGIRELYLAMTGDQEFLGGYHPERVQFSVTADLPGVLANVMNKLVVAEWQELGRSGYRWWESIVSVEHFTSLQQISGILLGEVTALPVVAEGDPYTELAVEDSREVGNWVKYGGYVGLSLEMFERDETHKLRAFPKKLASAGLRRVSALVGSVFTANGGLGPAMADGLNLFDNGRNNLSAAALSPASWEAASSAIWGQSMLMDGGPAPVLALDAKYLVVPRALRLAGYQILYPHMERSANIFSENLQRGEMGDVITCPEFTDPNDWAAVADPRLAPGIIIGERFGLLPEIIIADGARSGALFTNDEIRMKARHWLAVCVADYRPLHKANVV